MIFNQNETIGVNYNLKLGKDSFDMDLFSILKNIVLFSLYVETLKLSDYKNFHNFTFFDCRNLRICKIMALFTFASKNLSSLDCVRFFSIL